MTKEELEDKHIDAWDHDRVKSQHKTHAKISIAYAISVLEELQDEIGSLSPTAWQVIKDKKEPLKLLIK